MNTFKIESGFTLLFVIPLGLLLLLWPLLTRLLLLNDPSHGFVDPNLSLLVLISLISFLVITGLCWWLLQRFWLMMSLPALGYLVSQFKTLESWQQLSFFWASFALLLLTALGVFSAVI